MLEGVRVLDFTRVLAGPYCTAMLADLGAEVIKVEPPQGDDQRHMGRMVQGESTNFILNNRGKKSIRLDLKLDEGRRIARELAARSDVLIENFKPGVADKLGIGYAELSGLFPRLVYCSISGFGQNGPNAARPSYDVVAQAMSGLMSLTGEAEGAPTLIGESVGDICAGMFAAWGVMAALYDRERGGQGRHVDVAMFDSLLAMQPTALAQYLFGGAAPMRVGNRHPLSSPFGAYAANDGHLVIAAANDKLFQAVANTIGRPELPADPRFRTDSERSRNDAVLRPLIEAWSTTLSVQEAVAAMTRAGVPAAPIQDTAQAVDSEQARVRQLTTRAPHPVLGETELMEQPVHFSGMRRGKLATAPALGQHSAAVLGDVLGMDAAAIADLRAAGVI
ncbi:MULTISPECIES: CoA transferase [Achromobacter]|uniref:CaiB/BaiF CoA transferase family protein n=1 Tax=Achromobacter TaxID=222 RepID=UPI00244C2A1E|nr:MULTISPECIES: CoA transferase [Achromobacter]MDH1299795.1 CoA transferase [Achromobacter sp. GD03932]WLW59566.1 CoA transferase [Achromobacter aegrifaciens]